MIAGNVHVVELPVGGGSTHRLADAEARLVAAQVVAEPR